MTMSDTIMVAAIIIGLGASLTAIGLLLHSVFPAWVGRAEARTRAMPWRTLLLGIGAGGAGILLVAVLLSGRSGAIKFAGVVGLLALLTVSFAGTAGVARLLGSRLPSPVDRDRPWKAVIRGWVVLYLASLLPVLGWFVFLPLALLSGFGAALLGAFRSPEPPAPPAVPVRASMPEEREIVA